MPFTAPTLTQAQTDLSLRLYDPAFVRWTAAELRLYLREALRTWNAWTSTFRDVATFALPAATTYYDLSTVAPTLRGYTITNYELVTDLQYALLEPPAASGTWTGTDQFNLVKLTDAIAGRRDQFLRATGAVLTTSSDALAVTANGRYALAESVLTVRHADWTPTASLLRLPLLRTDEWAANNFRPAWVSETTPPRWYSTTTVPPLFMQIMPPPAGNGTLGMVSVRHGAALSPTASSLLSIPDDWVWVIKWGALADLLSADGLALDPQRSAYCEQRWQEGIALASKAAVVLTARVNGAVARLASLADADRFSPLWHGTPGAPRTLLHAGHNLVASWPPPDAVTGYTAVLDIIRNAPVPSAAGDILQVSSATYESILDYAQHIALFKEGPGQVQLAQALLESASSNAGIELRVQQAEQPSRRPLLGQSNQDEHAKARETVAVPVE